VRSAFVDLHLPRNSPVGIVLAFFAVILGFALIWRIYWLAGLDLVGECRSGPRSSKRGLREGARKLAALAIAQMGVHGAFFLHISSALDRANNFLALAFGVCDGLIVFGSIVIMAHHNRNMMPMDEIQR
jgi:hypothetical protein